MPRTRISKAGTIAALGLLAWLAQSDAGWFPQEYAPDFYVVKALCGLAAVIVLVVHINQTWSRIATRAQRFRYLLLLGFVVVVASASTAQYDGSPVTGRNIAGLLLAVATCVVAAVSIRQDRPR